MEKQRTPQEDLKRMKTFFTFAKLKLMHALQTHDDSKIEQCIESLHRGYQRKAELEKIIQHEEQ